MMRWKVSLAACLALAACATPEYRQERDICTAEWMQKIPPEFEQRLVTKTRTIEVPTGESTCRKVNDVVKCQQVMRTEFIPYTTVETVDVNETRRDAQIRACAQKACMARFGNPECDP
ncbi:MULTISPECIES: hypothetical protein [Sediminimonas]|uniref:Lipoprotein n=1 Tax=Sediminimonas qiaohouensis TaxID=552061 RepID=A0A7C9LS96_9RHOB|nr:MULTISPECIES: hypothetical protein [Sediminimonas]MDR9485804.1 hypothetical protein [Sediminimonas sp.]MTJ04856.1 hypothetical protein [Sediminimonas qiaohouensis]